jgi:hypothetical protein
VPQVVNDIASDAVLVACFERAAALRGEVRKEAVLFSKKEPKNFYFPGFALCWFDEIASNAWEIKVFCFFF